MTLTLFWIKIAAKRTVSLFKSSPVMFIWLFIIAGAFIFAISNRHMVITQEAKTFLIITPFLVLYSVFTSLKNYNVTPVLTIYSKSKKTNKNIIAGFFIIKAVINNILLILFSIIALNSTVNTFLFFFFISIPLFSIFLSFLTMYFNYNYINKQVRKKEKKVLRINPYLKSIVYDYLTPDFLAVFILCVSLFIIIITESFREAGLLIESNNQNVFFVFILILFSAGFSGIIGSIQNINWKFQTILSRNTFKYHYKRTVFFLAGTYAVFLAAFILIGSFINPILMFKYLFCILLMMFTAVNIALTVTNILIKVIIFALIIILTAWVSTLQTIFLAFLIIPALVTFIKAGYEYKEWSLL